MNPWHAQHEPDFFGKVYLVLVAFENAIRPVGIGFAVIEGAGPGAVGNRTYVERE